MKAKDINPCSDINSVLKFLNKNKFRIENERVFKLIDDLEAFLKIAKGFTPSQKILYEFFINEHRYHTGNGYGGVGNKNNFNQFWAWDEYIGETDSEGFLYNENGLYRSFPDLKRVSETVFMKFFIKYGALIFNISEFTFKRPFSDEINNCNLWELDRDDTGFNIRRFGWDEGIEEAKELYEIFDYHLHYKNEFDGEHPEEFSSGNRDYSWIQTESELEELFVEKCKTRGFRCTKNNARHCKGIPDRLVTGNEGVRCYVEIKKPFGNWHLSKEQLRCMSDLRESGCYVEILDDPYKIDDLLWFIKHNCHGINNYYGTY